MSNTDDHKVGRPGRSVGTESDDRPVAGHFAAWLSIWVLIVGCTELEIAIPHRRTGRSFVEFSEFNASEDNCIVRLDGSESQLLGIDQVSCEPRYEFESPNAEAYRNMRRLLADDWFPRQIPSDEYVRVDVRVYRSMDRALIDLRPSQSDEFIGARVVHPTTDPNTELYSPHAERRDLSIVVDDADHVIGLWCPWSLIPTEMLTPPNGQDS